MRSEAGYGEPTRGEEGKPHDFPETGMLSVKGTAMQLVFAAQLGAIQNQKELL